MILFAFRDTTLTYEMTTIASAQEIGSTVGIASTTKPVVDNSDTTTTAPMDSIMEVKTTEPLIPSTTLSNLTPTIVGQTSLPELPVTSADIVNKIQEAEPTTVFTLVTEPIAVIQPMDTNSINLPDAPIVIGSTTVPLNSPSAVAAINEDKNEMMKPSEDVTAAATASPNNPLFNFDFGDLNKLETAANGDDDNALSMSSNEDTTRMASSTDNKVDSGDKPMGAQTVETETPKSQETKTEPDGKSGASNISTSFIALTLAVLYVIV